jgi:hypothetical protein
MQVAPISQAQENELPARRFCAISFSPEPFAKLRFSFKNQGMREILPQVYG